MPARPHLPHGSEPWLTITADIPDELPPPEVSFRVVRSNMNPPDKVPAFFEDAKGVKTQIGWAKVRGKKVVIEVVPTQLGDAVKNAITKQVVNGFSMKMEL
jgi:hypothetical protein